MRERERQKKSSEAISSPVKVVIHDSNGIKKKVSKAKYLVRMHRSCNLQGGRNRPTKYRVRSN